MEEQGLSEDTIIIFTSDNGFFCGSRQLTGKALLYDESAKAPMIVYDPQNKGNGRFEEALISHVDIAPTILAYAGIEKPVEMQGASFVELAKNSQDEIHEAVFGENNFDNNLPIPSELTDSSHYTSIRSKFVRTKDFKFIRYQECDPVVEELWDMRKDSNETQNIIDNPAFARVAEKMRERLDNFENEYIHYYN